VAETKGWNRTWVYKLLHRLKVNPAAYRPEGDADGRGQGSGS